MKFPVSEDLTREQAERGMRFLIPQGMAAQTMATLTSGVFLVAFALNLGASNRIIGLIAAIPPLLLVLSVPSIYLVERVRNRRLIYFYSVLGARSVWAGVALIPILFGTTPLAIGALLIALLVHGAFAAAANTSWNSWMRDLVPEDLRGRFFSRRLALATAVGTSLSVVAAILIDVVRRWNPAYEQYGYSGLFFFGFLAGMVALYFISRVPEPRMVPSEIRFVQLLIEPFRDRNFRNLIGFLGSWHFAVNLAAPFLTVYMLRRLGLDLSVVIAFTVLSQMTNVLFLQIWGRISDTFSNKSVLRISGPLFTFCVLGFAFTTLPDEYFLTIPLLVILHIFMGIATAGVNIGAGNIALKLAPKAMGTAFLATTTLVNSLAAALASIIGGNFADFFVDRQLTWTLTWTDPQREVSISALDFQSWDFFFAFAFLVGIFAIHRLAFVREMGEVEDREVLDALFSEVVATRRNLSTIGGLWQFVRFPYGMLIRAGAGALDTSANAVRRAAGSVQAGNEDSDGEVAP